jgi:hypothetical protein
MPSGLGIPSYDYHSAHKPTADAPPRRRWTDGSSIAFVHDILRKPLPADYDTCDVLYADPPWQVGFGTFNERAGVDDERTYRDFTTALSRLIDGESRPIYLVTGRHALKALPDPAQVLPTRLNEDASVIVAYNVKRTRRSFGEARELLHALAVEHERVGDFCCGYGSAPRAFRRQGKTFVASDLNPSCIGYIAGHAASWAPVNG